MRDTWVRIAGASLRWTGLLLLAGLALRGKENLYYEWEREAPAGIGRPNLPNDPMPVHGIRLFPPQQPQIMPAADQAFTAILLGFESLEFLDPQRYWRGDPRARPNPLPHMKNGESPETFIVIRALPRWRHIRPWPPLDARLVVAGRTVPGKPLYGVAP